MRDVADHDHLVVVGALDDRHQLRRVLSDPGEDLAVHARDTGRRLAQTAAFRILADPLEDQAHTFFDLLVVEPILVHHGSMLPLGLGDEDVQAVRQARRCR